MSTEEAVLEEVGRRDCACGQQVLVALNPANRSHHLLHKKPPCRAFMDRRRSPQAFLAWLDEQDRQKKLKPNRAQRRARRSKKKHPTQRHGRLRGRGAPKQAPR